MSWSELKRRSAGMAAKCGKIWLLVYRLETFVVGECEKGPSYHVRENQSGVAPQACEAVVSSNKRQS
jgi:hypothetical protein